jgi:hypothetical protein
MHDALPLTNGILSYSSSIPHYFPYCPFPPAPYFGQPPFAYPGLASPAQHPPAMGLSFDDFCKECNLSVEVRDGLIALGFEMRDDLFVVTDSEYKQAVLHGLLKVQAGL